MNDPLSQFKTALIEMVPRLRRFAGVLVRSSSYSEDLLQSTLERALSRWHQWQPDSRLDNWMFTIMHSIWKNELRSRAIREGQGFVDVDSLMTEENSSSNERTILLDQVFKQVSGLPEEQRKAILLVYTEGYAYQEASDILEIPVGTLMSRLARARASLAQSLSDVEMQKKQVRGE